MPNFNDKHKLLHQEQLLHTELVKHGVDYHKAAKVAKILADKKSYELLTEEEMRLTREVCEAWLRQRNRLASIFRALE
jgi:hypothetical protein